MTNTTEPSAADGTLAPDDIPVSEEGNYIDYVMAIAEASERSFRAAIEAGRALGHDP
jgi:hypothetical protein